MKFHLSRSFILLLVIIPFCIQCKRDKLSAVDILEKSISYHDPNNKWSTLKTKLDFDEIHMKDSVEVVRKTQIWVDNSKGYFKIDRGGEEIHGMAMDSCFIEKGDFDCTRVERLRNYYIYLWGLPMKLKDSGTIINKDVVDTIWENEPSYKLQVAYEADSWSYFINKETFKLIGYSFAKKDGSGETILLSDEVNVNGMKIPQKRSWYTHNENKFLGTDILKEAKGD